MGSQDKAEARGFVHPGKQFPGDWCHTAWKLQHQSLPGVSLVIPKEAKNFQWNRKLHCHETSCRQKAAGKKSFGESFKDVVFIISSSKQRVPRTGTSSTKLEISWNSLPCWENSGWFSKLFLTKAPLDNLPPP